MSVHADTIAAIRFGYGFAPDMTEVSDAAGLLAQLEGPDVMLSRYGGPDLRPRAQINIDFAALRRRRRDEGDSFADKDAFRRLRRAQVSLWAADKRNVFLRAIYSPTPFRERLCAFWADHFTVSPRSNYQRAAWGHYLERAIRPHVAGNFAQILKAAVLHPSMLTYLDQVSSIGPNSAFGKRRRKGLNENLAREILELHTLGVGGGYTQTDVRQLAELLTGLVVNKTEGMVFTAQRAEPGAEEVLDTSYGSRFRKARLSDIEDFLEDVARHPDTARHIARKLAVHFVDDDPDPMLIDAMTTTFRATEGHLPSVYGAMLDHPAAWAPPGRKARQPFDFIVAGFRALGVPAATLEKPAARHTAKLLTQPLTAMGQPMQAVPGPDGWPEEAEAWITPQGVAARIQWALMAAQRFGDNRDPRAFVDTALRDLAGDTLRRAVAGAEDRTEGIALVLASPEFNRR